MGTLSEAVLIVILAGWIAGFGLAAARMARDLDRIEAAWFAIGALLGPIALLALRNAPPSRCRTCGSPTRGWGYTCWWCREDVRLSNASVISMEARLSRRGIGATPPGHVDRRIPGPAPRFGVMARNSDRPEDARERADRRPAAAVTSQVPVAGSTVPISSPGRTPPDPSKPVQSLRNRADAEPHRAPEAAPHRAPEAAPQPIATAVFVVGSARLEPGRRYSLAIRSNRLLVLGPIDIDPSTVALDRPVADIDVHAVEGRLVISEPRSGSGLALAFMAVTGATTEGIAAQIADAARQGSSQA